MSSEGKLGNLGEPVLSLSKLPEGEGYRVTKSPGVRGALPSPHEPEGTQTEGADRVLGSERTRSDPRGTGGSLSGAQCVPGSLCLRRVKVPLSSWPRADIQKWG